MKTPPRPGRRCSCHHRCFDPRPREGGDRHKHRSILADRLRVSIHAPAKGATSHSASRSISMLFRSTPPRRGRPVTGHKTLTMVQFRSTPPRRGRRPPRQCHPICHMVSIHAPAKGATRYRPKGRAPSEVSIHAPAKGATTAPPSSGVTRAVSIHAPAKGATGPLK